VKDAILTETLPKIARFFSVLAVALIDQPINQFLRFDYLLIGSKLSIFVSTIQTYVLVRWRDVSFGQSAWCSKNHAGLFTLFNANFQLQAASARAVQKESSLMGQGQVDQINTRCHSG